MPEREFFSLRNTVPGVTLILIILGINCYPLFQLLDGTNQGLQLFLGILTIITGSAIGFLVTQFWWGSFEAGKKMRTIVLRKVLNCVIEKFSIANVKKDYDEANRVFDFIAGTDDCRLSDYSSRRWDVFHLLSSTVFAIFLGLGLGGSLRYLLQFPPFSFPLSAIGELPIIIFTMIATLSLVISMLVNMKKCKNDFVESKLAVIMSFEPDIIANNFPVSFFNLTRFMVSHPNVDLEDFEEKGVFTGAMVTNMSSSEMNSKTGIDKAALVDLKCELDELLSRNREFHRLLRI